MGGVLEGTNALTNKRYHSTGANHERHTRHHPVRRTTSNDPVQRTYGTLPEASRRFGIGLKKLRQRAAENAFPVYSGETAWLRVKFSEVEAWLRSTRVPITQHACQRVEEVIAREEALDLRLAQAETRAERLDGMCGPISDAAKPYSEAIDRIEADRQALLAEGDVE
jgi:hypothetical protein